MKKHFSLGGIVFVMAGTIGAGTFLFTDIADAATVQFHLRHQETIFFEGAIELPAAGAVTLTDMDGVGHLVNSQSVLALFSQIDEASPAFKISKLQFFLSFNSFYVKCVEVQAKSLEACDNWQYVVNGVYPSVGMDSYVLSGGENVWIYFGNIRQAVPQQGTFFTDNPFTFRAEQYQYEINGWVPITGYRIGVKKDGVEVATQLVDSEGKAALTVSEAGDYIAGIVEDFYFPSTPFKVALFVPPSGPIGASRAVAVEEQRSSSFQVEKAVRFLEQNQSGDGSFRNSPLLSDWAAIALAAYEGTAPGREKLRDYLMSNQSPGASLPDYERRAMALMVFGISPWSGTETDYISKIAEAFDGTQFGDPDLVNDDVFAVLVLRKAGYGSADPEISNAVAFILTWQKEDGSWIDVDMTAAAAQALVLARDLPAVQEALAKGATYLLSKKGVDGSFGNVYSTSWAIQALKSLGQENDLSALAARQGEDGGLEPGDTLENRVWATSYAIPAALGKPWGSLLKDFPKQVPAAAEQSAGGGEGEMTILTEEQLSQVESEIAEIERKVAVLKEQVRPLYVAYLARSIERVSSQIAALEQELTAAKAESGALAASSSAKGSQAGGAESPAVALENQPGEETLYAAAVGETKAGVLGNWREIALVVAAGIGIFVLLGGTKLFVSVPAAAAAIPKQSFLQKLLARIRKKQLHSQELLRSEPFDL